MVRCSDCSRLPELPSHVRPIEGNIESYSSELLDHVVHVLVLIVFPRICEPQLRHRYAPSRPAIVRFDRRSCHIKLDSTKWSRERRWALPFRDFRFDSG
jgi:hypothetical protein